jgi:imidazolonepropionase-like amidohydrolase
MYRLLWVILLASKAFPQPTLVHAGRILDVAAGSYRQNQGILIDAGIIRQVGAYDAIRAAAPQNAVLIDLSSATVLPGLIDCHAHLMLSIPDHLNGADGLILTAAKYTPAKRVLLGAQLAKEVLESGFTIVRNVGHSGIDGDVALRDAINNGWVPGPRILATARKIAPRGGQAMPVQDRLLDSILQEDFLTASNPEEGRHAVLDNLRVGADWIKVVIDEGNRRTDVATVKAIVAQAHDGGVKVAAHATSLSAIQTAIDSGVDTIEHADEGTEAQFQAMRAKGIYYVPTLWPKELYILWPNVITMNPPRRAPIDQEAVMNGFIAEQRTKLDRARKVGVKIVFGSDEVNLRSGKTRGQVTLALLAALEGFGMSPAESIRSATLDAAEMLQIKDRAGSIEPNKFGDLIAVAGDPLEHLTAIESIKFVMKGGRIVRDEIHVK